MYRECDKPIYELYDGFIDRVFVQEKDFLQDKDDHIFTKEYVGKVIEIFANKPDRFKGDFNKKAPLHFHEADPLTKNLFSHAIWLWGFSLIKRLDTCFETTDKKAPTTFAGTGQNFKATKYEGIKYIVLLFDAIINKKSQEQLDVKRIKDFIINICLSCKHKDDYKEYEAYKNYRVVREYSGNKPIVEVLLYLSDPTKYERIVSVRDKNSIANCFSYLLNTAEDAYLIDKKIKTIRERIKESDPKQYEDFDFYDASDICDKWKQNSSEATLNSSEKDNQLEGDSIQYIKSYSTVLKNSKNIIFRGAPGTGKTYLAKEIASDIVSGGRTIDYDDLTDDERSQIGFVQFHPNYDYSDFIEGLRPIMNADNSLGFKLQDGVFKSFVNRARKNYEDAHKENNVAKSDYIIQTSIEEFLDEIKFNETQLETKTGSKYLISDADSAYIYIFIPQNNVSNSIKLRITELKKLLTSDSEFENPKDVTAFFNHPKTQEDSYYFSLYCQIATIKKKLQKKHVTPAVVSNVKEKDYVFIIDEINRGEISKILGELFFSIDPGYRGKAGEIFTQYSNMHDDLDEKFYIPDNVYIIGTMNDIDRSVDSFDFAMRRRFRFIEIKASENTQMLHTLGDEMEREAIIRMNSLNAAIISEEGDLNENYQIGASYFLKLKTMTFGELWTDCLKPLLSDYIQGMYDEKGIMAKFEKAYYIETDEGNADEIN